MRPVFFSFGFASPLLYDLISHLLCLKSLGVKASLSVGHTTTSGTAVLSVVVVVLLYYHI